jgi:glycosyltransferase involved in cell wall biosynthesis
MPKLAILNTHPIQYFAPLYRRLAKEPDLDLTVYFCSRQGAEEYLDPGFGERVKWDRPLLDGYNYHFLKNVRRHDRVRGFWSLINPGIVLELRKHKYDALIVNGHRHATYLLAMFAAKAVGTAVMMRCETHLGLQASGFKRLVRKPLMSFLYNQVCDLCLPIGTLNRDFYSFHGVSEARLFPVPYAVDNEYFIAAAEKYSKQLTLKQELGLPLDKPLILFASKLMARKRPMDLLRAFHRLQASGTDAALGFVGSGEEEQALRGYARENQLRDVHFCGFQNQSELPKFYSAADVFVFPSENEPWGLVLNEVMCASLPVITSREIGAAPDLVHEGKNGFMFEAGNVDELTSYLKRIVVDPKMRKRLGEESRRIIEMWDYESCLRGIASALARTELGPRHLTEGQAA